MRKGEQADSRRGDQGSYSRRPPSRTSRGCAAASGSHASRSTSGSAGTPSSVTPACAIGRGRQILGIVGPNGCGSPGL